MKTQTDKLKIFGTRGEKEFTTDGCSGGMSHLFRLVFRKPPPWEGCCVEHDWAYWNGGCRYDRRLADLRLWMCMAENGYYWWGMLMYFSVRLGGAPYWPLSWRWGYGHDWGNGYHAHGGREEYTLEQALDDLRKKQN